MLWLLAGNDLATLCLSLATGLLAIVATPAAYFFALDLMRKRSSPPLVAALGLTAAVWLAVFAAEWATDRVVHSAFGPAVEMGAGIVLTGLIALRRGGYDLEAMLERDGPMALAGWILLL